MAQVIESERGTCSHLLDEATCAYCAFPSLVIESESARTTRTAARLAAAIRQRVREHERERDLLRGYSLLSVSMVDAIESAASAVARPYGGDVAGVCERVLDALALWLARQDRGTIESVRGDSHRVRALAARIAARIARGAGTGRGHMPRLRIGEHAPECTRECVGWCGALALAHALDGLVIREYRAAVAAIDADTWARLYVCAVHESESACALDACAVLDARRARVARVAAASVDSMPVDRAPTASESEGIAGVLDYERAPGSPDYPRWLDAFGESAPNVGSAHPFGNRAPGVPERDSDLLRRGSMVDAAAYIGLDARLLSAALSNVRKSRRGYVLDARAAAAVAGDTRHLSNVRKSITAALTAVQVVDRSMLDVPRHTLALMGAQARPVVRGVHEHTRGERGCKCGQPIIESTYRGGIRMLDASAASEYVCREHALGECPRTCAVRMARVSRIESVYVASTRGEYLSAIADIA